MTADQQDQKDAGGQKASAPPEEKWSTDDLTTSGGAAHFGVDPKRMIGALHGQTRKTFSPDDVKKLLRNFASHEETVDDPSAEEA